jgi:hypothetical protein
MAVLHWCRQYTRCAVNAARTVRLQCLIEQYYWLRLVATGTAEAVVIISSCGLAASKH